MLQMRLRSRIAVAVACAGGYSSDSTPSLGTSICHGYSPKKQKIKIKIIAVLLEGKWVIGRQEKRGVLIVA